MPHSCAVKTCQNKARTGTCLSFHRLPVREPERLNLWLFALNIDINTPQEELRKYIVCSEHFVPEDYTANGQPGTGRMHRFLTSTAVPTMGVSSCSPQLSVPEVSFNIDHVLSFTCFYFVVNLTCSADTHYTNITL
uniref:THAP domain-containing protein 1 n=1 Tax=Lates calcarifer TaxID=8187 RepID=A0A4W6DTI2_LATCA